MRKLTELECQLIAGGYGAWGPGYFGGSQVFIPGSHSLGSGLSSGYWTSGGTYTASDTEIVVTAPPRWVSTSSSTYYWGSVYHYFDFTHSQGSLTTAGWDDGNGGVLPPFLTVEQERGQLLENVRDRVSNGYLSTETFAMMVNERTGPNDTRPTFREVFGAPKILQFSYNVAGLGEHIQYVYIPRTGDAQLISGGPLYQTLGVAQSPQNQNFLGVYVGAWTTSNFAPATGDQRFLDVTPASHVGSAWSEMTMTAQMINDRGLNYNVFGQNSNSVAATVAAAGGVAFYDGPGDGSPVGWNNNLTDELNGGWQLVPMLPWPSGSTAENDEVDPRR